MMMDAKQKCNKNVYANFGFGGHMQRFKSLWRYLREDAILVLTRNVDAISLFSNIFKCRYYQTNDLTPYSYK